MSLQNASLASNPTSLSVTGGTAKSFQVTGEEVKNGVALVDISETDPRLRRKITVRSVPSKLQPDGSYSKEKRWVTFRVPSLDASGNVVVDIYRYEANVAPTTVSTTDLNQRLTFSQTLFDTDFETFHTTGSLY
jgi:hypothetical protein